jgi:hypothetical protein
MSGAKFGSEWTGDGDNGFGLSMSEDGQTLTFRFAEIQADVDAGKSPDLTVARVFSAILPVHGDGSDVTINFFVQGYAFTTGGADAYVVLSVNGQTAVQHFSAETDQDFDLQLIVKGVPTSQCHLAVVAVVQRDPANPDAVAALRPSTVDAAIQPS